MQTSLPGWRYAIKHNGRLFLETYLIYRYNCFTYVYYVAHDYSYLLDSPYSSIQETGAVTFEINVSLENVHMNLLILNNYILTVVKCIYMLN